MAQEADIGDLSLYHHSPPTSPPAAGPSALNNDFSLNTPSRSGTTSPTASGRPRGPLRIPSSPSSSNLSPPLPPLIPPAPPLLRTQRALSRSNSSPRARRAPSQDLSVQVPQPAPSTKALNRWVQAFVLVNFDLDVGPVVQLSHPPRRWGVGVSENIAFSSFPDTSLFSEGKVGWSFKLNDEESKGKGKGVEGGSVRTGEGGGKEDGRLWGFVMFVQKRDGTIKRGYFQKSLVILTPLPYPSLFSALVAYLAPLYFAHGAPVLEQACREISKWPDPTPGTTVELPFLGQTFSAQLPEPHQASQPFRRDHVVSAPERLANLHSLGSSSAPPTRHPSPPSGHSPHPPSFSSGAKGPISNKTGTSLLLGLPPGSSSMARSASATNGPTASLQPRFEPPPVNDILASLPLAPPIPLFSTALLPSLWVLWECLILAEPLLVIAPDPRTCSEMIWWLRDFVRPLPPSGDLRPYFHIHDASFALLVNTHQPTPGTVLGVTNPFFRTTCAHWPNVVTVGERLETNLPGLGKRAMLQPQAGKGEAKEGFKTKRKRVVHKDKVSLKRWEGAVGSPEASSRQLNDELRFHFSEMTEKFLFPLNRYFETLIPTNLKADAQNSLPPLKPFSPSSFLASLKAQGHPTIFRSNLLSGGQSEAAQAQTFYEGFMKSKNFGVWLAWMCEEARVECEKRARREGWSGQQLLLRRHSQHVLD